MEVIVRDVRGIDGDATISIRAGNTRRQIPLSCGKVIQFPTLPMNSSPLKIDLLRQLGTCKINVGATPEIYTAMLNSETEIEIEIRDCLHMCGGMGGMDGAFGTTQGTVQGLDVTCTPEALEAKKAALAEEARTYLKRFGLLGFLQELLQYIIREKPDDPFVFMAAYLAKVTGYQDMTYAAAAARTGTMPPRPAAPDEAVFEQLNRHNARLDNENERLNAEISDIRKFCDESLPKSQSLAVGMAPEDCIAMVTPAVAHLEGALRTRRYELDVNPAVTWQERGDEEELHKAVTSFCYGFSDIAGRLASAVISRPVTSQPYQGLPASVLDDENAAYARNLQLETENDEMARQIQELERSLLAGEQVPPYGY